MKKFIFTIVLAIATVSIHAQVDTSNPLHLQNVGLSYIPASMSYDGKVHFISGTSETSQSSFDIYNENLKVIKTINYEGEIDDIFFHDLDNAASCISGDGEVELFLTQTLFNNDEKYEYVVWNTGKCQIMNEDGKVLGELSNPIIGDYNPRITLYKANGKFYLYVGYEYLYPINKNTTDGINTLGAPIKLKANPSFARRNQTIKVELGEDSEKARTVSVTNAAGQRVWQGTAQPGQKSVSIEARRLGQGVNVVNVEGTTKKSSCKVIVR